MQPWKPHLAGPTREEVDIAATAPTLLVRVGAGLVLVAGAVAFLTGLQSALLVTIRGPMSLAPYALLVLGFATVVAATLIWRMRGYGAIAATALTGVQIVVTSIWLFYSFGHGFFTLYALFAPLAQVVGVVFAAVSIAPCVRASAGRARLAAAGLDFGI